MYFKNQIPDKIRVCKIKENFDDKHEYTGLTLYTPTGAMYDIYDVDTLKQLQKMIQFGLVEDMSGTTVDKSKDIVDKTLQ